MLNKRAIGNFLSRQFDSYDWLKGETVSNLHLAMGELVPPPDFGQAKLWQHQQVAFLLLHYLKRFMLFLSMGAGKTCITLNAIKYRKQKGESPRAVVMVPYVASVGVWIDENAKFTPDLQCVPLTGTTKANLERLQGPGDLFVICYQSAVAMVTETIYDKKRKKTKWVLTSNKVRAYFAGFDTLILDEVHKCKDTTTLLYRMCRALSSQCGYVVGLTGTPFGKDPTPLWAQFYLIDFGETLGPSLGFYRAVFFNAKPNYWGGMEYTFKPKMLPDLKRIIKNKSIHYGINELNDMPQKQYIVRPIAPALDSEGYRKAALHNLEQAIRGKEGASYELINSNYLQLCQLSSGFMTLKGEDTERVQIEFDENPKLDTLIEIIEGLDEATKVVVFHKFIFSNHAISKRLTAIKIKHARIWGGQRKPVEELRRFKDDPTCRVMVINTRSGSSSLNLQNANVVCFYEQPDESIDRQQAEARVWRSGQLNRVLIYDFLVNGTWDARIHQSNKAGENLLKQLLSGVKHAGLHRSVT